MTRIITATLLLAIALPAHAETFKQLGFAYEKHKKYDADKREWSTGDFNGDGTVSIPDLNVVGGN